MGGQGGWEWRIEAFVKIHFFFGGGSGRGRRVGGQGGCERKSKVFCENSKKKIEGGGVGRVWGGGVGGSDQGLRGEVRGSKV